MKLLREVHGNEIAKRKIRLCQFLQSVSSRFNNTRATMVQAAASWGVATENVERAAITLGPCGDLPIVGFGKVVVQHALGNGRKDAGAADLGSEQSRDGQRHVADRLGIGSETGPAREEAVARVAFLNL